jgi:HK97 family phage prohead protease
VEIMEFDGLTAATFSVDQERRTMRGVVVPWNKVGSHRNGRKWRFARGALKFSHEKYVKFNNDHDQSQGVGRAIAAEDTDAGLVMTFKVKDGPRGDRVLAMAKDGSKTGLSVEVEIDTMDTGHDPENPGTLLVSMANLTGVAFVKEPAFDDSRLISVMANKEGTAMDTCEHCGAKLTLGVAHTCPTPTNDPVPAPVMFSADQLAWMHANGFGAPAPAPVNEPRPVIQPTTVTTQVTEPQNYRFDREGNLQVAAHDFGRDMIRALNTKYNDQAARDRVSEFVKAQFAVITTDVNELNPTVNQNRYIDQREYRSPVWDRINKGAPPNGVNPFAWPSFSSASGLVGAHTEGVEPTSGSYVTTNQTVTPTATSGKAKISRETWDMGGTPGIGGLIWRQMTRGYKEALEAKAIAVLDAATPTSLGTFTVGGGTTGQTLAAELVAALAKLQFVRGGFSMDSLFAQIDLYLALVGAKTTDGAYLFPALGATNRDGTVANRFGSLDINGVVALPSWALAATGIVPASSYLFDSLSVDGWATPPTEIDMFSIEVANVYIGIWGYSAAAINDINGVRELIYDPS